MFSYKISYHSRAALQTFPIHSRYCSLRKAFRNSNKEINPSLPTTVLCSLIANHARFRNNLTTKIEMILTKIISALISLQRYFTHHPGFEMEKRWMETFYNRFYFHLRYPLAVWCFPPHSHTTNKCVKF